MAYATASETSPASYTTNLRAGAPSPFIARVCPLPTNAASLLAPTRLTSDPLPSCTEWRARGPKAKGDEEEERPEWAYTQENIILSDSEIDGERWDLSRWSDAFVASADEVGQSAFLQPEEVFRK